MLRASSRLLLLSRFTRRTLIIRRRALLNRLVMGRLLVLWMLVMICCYALVRGLRLSLSVTLRCRLRRIILISICNRRRCLALIRRCRLRARSVFRIRSGLRGIGLSIRLRLLNAESVIGRVRLRSVYILRVVILRFLTFLMRLLCRLEFW